MVADKKHSGQMAVAALLILGVADISLTYALASYGSGICGLGKSETNDALVLQLFASSLFVVTATICAVHSNRASNHKTAWINFAVVFILAETILKLAAAMIPSFYLC